MDMVMEVTTMGNGIPVIALEGELDVYGALQLKKQIFGLLENGHINQVVDMAKVKYLNSTGLSALVQGLNVLRADSDGNLIIIRPIPRVRRVFEITCLDKVFQVCNTAEEAVEIFKAKETKSA